MHTIRMNKRFEEVKFTPGQYEITYSKNKTMKKIKEFIIKIIKKLKIIEPAKHSVIAYSPTVIQFDKIYKCLDEKIMNEIYYKMYRREDFVLLIGANIFKKLMDEDFDEQLNFIWRDFQLGGNRGYVYKDLKVVIEPCLTEVLLIRNHFDDWYRS